MNEAFKILTHSAEPHVQEEAIRALKGNIIDYQPLLLKALVDNPFLALPPRDRTNLLDYMESIGAPTKLVMLRQLSASMDGRRSCVFCMPKSGSSFVQSAIQSATKASFAMLTNYTCGSTSYFGMNGRMQELDELAIMFSIFGSSGKFVAQHHTRCTPFLASQLKFFKIRPIVTVRNVYDCIMSADDMFIKWRSNSDWTIDGPFSLPAEFPSLPKGKRIELLSYGFGVWLIDFYLSWKRCERRGFVDPLWITYEQDVVGQRKLSAKLESYLNMDNAECERLRSYIDSPDKARSRLNKGISGRGLEVPEHAKLFLKDYASNFGSELNDEDFFMLFGG